MEKFFSCDWGTSAFRLRLVEIPSLKIIVENSSKQGIAETHKRWIQSGQPEDNRLFFYVDIIQEQVKEFEKKLDISLSNIPIIISGMASSTIGMIDLPYKKLPFAINGVDLKTETIQKNNRQTNDLIIISGVRTEDDIIRGEETKLVGHVSEISHNQFHTFIFPGTHPKHITVKDEKVVAFKTYMTGEFFDILSKKSVLAVSLEEGGDLNNSQNLESFEHGVKDGHTMNILHSCFLVRTNDVLRKKTKQENYFYLSGLLIGAELVDLQKDAISNITLIGNETLNPYYIVALRVLSLSPASIEDADEALIRGQFRIYSSLGKDTFII